MNTGGFDLNLLLAFDALLVERNVTRAARRVGLSQPAMSNALARLRIALDDPLFLRTKSGMVPTTRAQALGRALGGALRDIDRALGTSDVFDPKTADRSFTIAASDYVACVALAPLIAKLDKVAPNVAIRVVPLEPDVSFGKLEAGTIDLTIGYFRNVPSSLQRAHLFDDHLVGLVRRGHPLRGTRNQLREIASYPHVRVAPQGETRGLLDIELAKRGLARKVTVTSPHFLLALLAADSDVVAVIPQRLARWLEKIAHVSVLPIKVDFPKITVNAYWHPHASHDAGHAWLRTLLSQRHA